uniref:Laminin subunit alpha 3 n=1 Tax=Scophthalmus maximus TaxID=52904 RepID=A0A8D3D4N3_SCOMX
MARRRRGAHLLAAFFALSMALFGDANGQEAVTGFSLSPPYFNLAEGSRISASATCGQDEAGTPRYDLYCKLVGGPNFVLPTQNSQGQFCDYCNSVDPSKARPVTNAIDGTERWWQSPPLSRGPGYNEVNVTLDLGQLFHVAYVLIKFANSPRPDLWVLERSVDNGRTFTPWQYFAHSKRECIERFGKQPNARILNDDDQRCMTEYSRIVPLENGEIVVSLVNGRPGSKNFTYSPVLRDFTKATNIRLHFLRTSTLLGHLISKAQRDPTVTRRYYYSIKDISIGGRCVCHGHAEVCGGGHYPDNPNRLQCECQHNTCGDSCDRCCPGFNHKLWRAATVSNPNECQACQCFSHASDCYYDPEVEKRGASLDTFGRYDGGGVCINCQHNSAGVNCERCLEGFYRPYGIPPESPTCTCDERTAAGCEMGSGRCICKPQFAGENCDRCAEGYYYYPQCIRKFGVDPTTCPPGYFGPPTCQQCICDYRGTGYRVCDASGRCLCRQGVEGERCNRCQPGYHSFPNCQACLCDGAGVADSVCSPSGQCICLSNFGGQECDGCAPGYYGYPDCAACRCSPEGSHGNICNPLSGQCLCLPGVVGQQCDHCASGLRFPQCAGTEVANPQMGSCQCLQNVGGTLCDRCKPLYWNLATDNPHGCIACRCDLKGTLSGVGECEQKRGQCHCKPNACGHSCDTCKDGFFLLQKKDYFGCQGCQCDVGGAIDTACDEISGRCRCRKNIVGLKCNEPAPSYYFPTLHQLKFEVEDGTTPNARPVRFGYNPQEFPDFSWQGYAVMSPAQPEVILTLTLGFPGAFHIVMRYASPKQRGRKRVRARILVVDEAGSDQSKDVIFPESRSPSFLTVPGEGFAEPFALTPGKWIFHIRAEGILLDYLVLLPSDYYEAPLLQEKITQPCTYLPTANMYAVPAEEFSTVYVQPKVLCVSTHGRFTEDSSLLFFLFQTEINFTPRVPLPGRYVVVVHYHQPEHTPFPVEVRVDAGRDWRGSINASYCPAVSGCREVVVADGRIALDLDHDSWRLPTISVIVPSRKTLFLDYILLVPDRSYTPDLLKERPLDNSVSTMSFCRDSARSLVAAYNDGALPCNCDESGSTGSTCDAVGGQCPCRQHIIGRQCTKCATGYYGFPYCRPCECGRRLCDEVTGSCICPPQTVKPACDVCQTQTFNYHPLLGCEGCECSPNGIKANAGPECERTTGQCSCKPRIAGRKCDRCAAGYYRFPDCLPCNCKQGGVTPEVCHPDTGRCLCKRNVAGVRCDTCREGSFYFDHSNSHGCTSCFCFGATDKCQSSSKRRGKSVEMRGWRLIRPDQEEVPSVLNTASNTVVSDIQELPPTVQTLHWVAPQSYLGDRVTSYGGFLTYQSKSFGIPSEGMTLMDRRPDVVLTGRNMTLIHMAPHVPLPDRLYQGRVHLVEGNWRHAVTNRPVTREEFMMVLAGLVGLRIQALYFTQSQRLSLGEVGLEEATNTGAGGPGNTVEHCSCPPQYTGDSCEKCAPGFYRDGSRPFLGHCVPCECNGLSDECEEKSGSFAIGCREVFGDIRCVCRLGYAGEKCERCSLMASNKFQFSGDMVPNVSINQLYFLPLYSSVLEYIKANVSKQCDQNEAAAEKIRGLLKAHEAKLKDLDKALKEATDLVMKANEYEQLAAQLDGAKTDLTKKVNEISKAAAQEDIVKAAEDHAKNLSKLAKELEEFFYTCCIFLYLCHLLAVKDLLNTIPSLDDKISEVENLTSHLSPISNISENIKKIKDLIEQARDAANRISIPMKFTGDGYVQMRPPKNLEDLKAFTSLSLSLQRPEGRGDGTRRRRQITQKDNMFVLYLGNRDVRKCKKFFFLQFRIYQDAQMVLTKDITSSNPGEPILSNNQGEESKNLLDISPSDVVFYVGGYPDNFTLPVSMNFPKYKGCIEFSSVNDKVVSLYNFQQAENINLQTPCKRYVPITFRTDDNTLFSPQANGINLALENGYMILSFNNKMWKSNKQYHDGQWHYLTVTSRSGRPHFSLDVRTRSPEGLLFFAATRGGRSHLALYMSKGRIRLSAGKQKEIFNREKYNDGKWHSVRGFKKKFRLVVDGIRAQDGQLTTTELTSMQQFMSPLYLGSVPESLHRQLKSKALPRQSVSGCIRNFKMNGALMSNPATNTGAGPCFEGPTQRGAYFSGNGAHVIISDSFDVGSSFELLFNIRPRSPTGLLLNTCLKFRRALSMGPNVWTCSCLQVVAQVNNGNGKFMVSMKPKASLCDGMFHKISVIKRKNVVQLHVDTADKYKIGPSFPTVTSTKDTLYVGGIPGECCIILCMSIKYDKNTSICQRVRLSPAFGPVNLKECPG